jgi:hypothetical protein
MPSFVTMRRHAIAFGLSVLAGCKSSSDGSVPSTSSNGSVLPRPIPHGSGATDLLLRHTVGGGFSGYGFNWTGLPVAALFGDGRVVFATVAGNPTSPQMREARLTAAQIEQLLERADELGLFSGSTMRHDFEDADVSVLTLRAADRCVSHSATPPPVADGQAAFLAQLHRLLTADVAATATPWQYELVAIEYNRITPAAGCAGAPLWPLEAPTDAPVTQRFCRVLARQLATTLVPPDAETDRRVATTASGCVGYVYRPLLPGETGCPDAFSRCP